MANDTDTFALSGEEIPVTRSFERVETWEALLERWEQVKTEPEAVGLLYHAAKVKMPWNRGPDESSVHMEERIKFFLDAAALPNKQIATVAAQAIVKHLLSKRGAMEINGQWYVKADGMLLQFLREPQECLCDAPYPRFIGEYLTRAHSVWSTGNPEHRRAHEAYQSITPYLLDALLAWGMAGLLAYGSDEHRELIEQKIEAMLKSHGSFGYTLTQALSDIDKEPFKTFPPAAKEEAARRAALVLMRHRVWKAEFGDAARALREGTNKS